MRVSLILWLGLARIESPGPKPRLRAIGVVYAVIENQLARAGASVIWWVSFRVHRFIERLIGTVRREYLDHMFFWNAIDLTRKLDAFADYYNEHRVHRSLNGTTPTRCAGASSPPLARAALRQYAWEGHCHGLFYTPIPA